MTNPQILEYLKSQLTQGVSRDIVKKNLLMAGFNEKDINEAVGAIDNQNQTVQAQQSIPVPNVNIISNPTQSATTSVPSPVTSTLDPINNQTISQPQPLPQNIPPVTSIPNSVQNPLPNAEIKQQPVIASIPVIQAMPAVEKFVPQAPQINHTNGHGKLYLYVGIAGLMMIAAAAGAIYFLGSRPSPEVVYNKAKENIFSWSSYKNIYTLDAQGESTESSPIYATSTNNLKKYPFSIKLNLNFAFDYFDANKKLLNLVISVKSKTDDQSIGNMSLGLEARYKDKVLYAKLTEAPNIGFFSLKPLENQWVKFDTEASTSPLYVSDQAEQDRKIEKTKSQIKQLIIAHKIITITKDLGTEDLDGVSSYHYKFNLDKNDLNAFLVEVQKIGQEDYPQTAEQQKMYAEDIKKQIGEFDIKDGDLWISKSDLNISRIKFNITYKPNTENKSFEIKKVTIDSKVADINKPVDVVVPENAMDIKDVFSKFMSGSYSQASSTTQNSPVKATSVR